MNKLKNLVARIAIRALLWAGGWKMENTPRGMRWTKWQKGRCSLIGDWRYAVHETCRDEFWEKKESL